MSTGNETECCWLARHTHGVDHVKECHLYYADPQARELRKAATFTARYGPEETTGEHTLAKLADNPYGGVTKEQAVKAVDSFKAEYPHFFGAPGNQFGGVPGLPVSSADTGAAAYSNQYLRDMAANPQDAVPAPAPARRGWTPTAGEIGLSLGIVGFIVFIFCFLVIAY